MRPYAVASSYAYQCRKLGVRIATSTTVEEILSRNGRVSGVKTDRDAASCRYVINAAGANAYHIAKLAGLELPIVPVRHEYFVSVPVEGMVPELPCFRVPELTLYGRPCESGLLLGGWETQSLQTDPREYGLNAEPPPVEPDWMVLNSFEQQFSRLLPQTRDVQENPGGTRLADVYPGWTFYHRRKLPRARLCHGGGLQCPRHQWFGRDWPAGL